MATDGSGTAAIAAGEGRIEARAWNEPFGAAAVEGLGTTEPSLISSEWPNKKRVNMCPFSSVDQTVSPHARVNRTEVHFSRVRLFRSERASVFAVDCPTLPMSTQCVLFVCSRPSVAGHGMPRRRDTA